MNLGIAPSSSGSVQSSTASSFSRVPQGSPASVLRRARLDPGVVDEELLVQRDEVLRLFRRLVLGEDRLHRAHRLAGPAVDTLVGVDEELVRPLIDAVHRADLDAGLVLDVDARLDDHVRHRISPLYRAGPASFGELWPGPFIEIRREEAHQLVVLGRVPPKLPRREASLGKAVEKRMRHRRMAHDLVPERLNEGRWGDLCRHVDDPDGTAPGRRTARAQAAIAMACSSALTAARAGLTSAPALRLV